MELSPDLIVIHDSEGQILYMNAAGLNMLRISYLDQIIGKNIKDLIIFNEGSKLKTDTLTPAFQNDRHEASDCILKRMDGSTIPAELNLVFFYYESKPAYQVIARDVSLRVQAEEKRKKAEEALIQNEKPISPIHDT